MIYGIIGSRHRIDRNSIQAFISSIPDDSIVISGGCQGVDKWAIQSAKARGLPTREYLPNLANCKKYFEYTKAYYARNKLIAANCDVLAAFVSDNRKGGTENTIKYAKKFGKKIIIL